MSHDSLFCAREQGRRAALAGRPIFANPHLGGDADAWFAGYREIPEADHGSQPNLKAPPRTVSRRRKSMAEAGVKALGDRVLPGSTPMQDAIAAEVAERRARTPYPWADGEAVGL